MQSRNAVTIDTTYLRYMVTISCQQKLDYINKSSLDSVILYLKLAVPRLKLLLHVYENTGRYKQLHWHGLITVPYPFYYRRHTHYSANQDGNSFRIQWTPVTFLKGAISYLQKDLRYQTQNDIFLNNYYSVNRFYERYLT